MEVVVVIFNPVAEVAMGLVIFGDVQGVLSVQCHIR